MKFERIDHRDVTLILGAVMAAAVTALLHGAVPDDGDFAREAAPAYRRLMAGDVAGFWDATPGYLTFVLVVGVPCALVADVFGWGTDGAFRLMTLPGAFVLGALAVTVIRSADGVRRRALPAALFLAAGGPIAWLAVHYGHPEDLLAAGACVAAVLVAMKDRWLACAALLTIAVLAKQWAVFAVLPAAAVAPRSGLRILLAAGSAAVAVLLFQYFLHPVAASAMTSTATGLHTRQFWYPFGLEAPPGTTKPGERLAPAWLSSLTRPLTVAVVVALSAAWYWRRRRLRVAPEDVFALLALIFLLRCLLDPWNFFYYHLPLLVSLVAWEVLARRRFPWLALGVAVLVFCGALRWEEYNGWVAYFSYVGWAVPLAGLLLIRALRIGVPGIRPVAPPSPEAVPEARLSARAV